MSIIILCFIFIIYNVNADYNNNNNNNKIPLTIINCLEGRSLPVYGDGENIRDWLYVEDHCRAIDLIMKNGVIGNTYNIGGLSEMKNIYVVKKICNTLDKISPNKDGTS